MANDPLEDSYKSAIAFVIKFVCTALVVLSFMLLVVFSGCGTVKDLTIPEEPTIWIVSFIHHDEKNPLPNGMVGYKMIPVNPGSINAKPTWKLDYAGKYYVGQRVDFAPIQADK